MRRGGLKRRMAAGAVIATVAAAGILGACSPQVAGQAALSSPPIIDPSNWADEFPYEYESYIEAGHATYAHVGATGKVNAHLDVMDPPPGYASPFMTGCLSCHSSAYQSAIVAGLGDELFTTDVEQVKEMVEFGITCYSCHGNTPGEMVPVNRWVVDAAAKGGIETSDANMVCAQCHSMGDFSVQFSDTDSSKWSFLQAGLDPDDMWAYMTERGNENPITPTAEVVFNNFVGSTHDQNGVECIDCHMQTKVAEDGEEYTVHQWQSVGTNEELYENCMGCHTDSVSDRKAEVEKRQAEFSASMQTVQERIAALTEAIEKAKESGDVSQETIDQATTLMNKATFYLAYGSDQSLGFHSLGTGSATVGCHEAAAQAAEEGLALLG